MSRKPSLCLSCKRLFATGDFCEAYPNGIPEAVYWSGHFKSKPGDHGLQFFPKEGLDKDILDFLRKDIGETEDEDYKELEAYYQEQDMSYEEWAAMTRQEWEKSGLNISDEMIRELWEDKFMNGPIA